MKCQEKDRMNARGTVVAVREGQDEMRKLHR